MPKRFCNTYLYHFIYIHLCFNVYDLCKKLNMKMWVPKCARSMDKCIVATPLWVKCEDETHTPKSGNLESFGTFENSELDCRGQNTLHWGVLYIVGKVLKSRCPKWSHMSHLDICSLSYEQKKGRESNWQFDSRPLKVGNWPDRDVCRRSATWRWKALEESYKIALDPISIRGLNKKLRMPKIPKVQPGIVSGVPGKSAIRM